MEINEQYPEAVRQAWREEIERAIANAKRSELQRWFRRQWYKAEARSNWPEWRRQRRRLHRRGTAGADSQDGGTIRPTNGGDWNGKVWSMQERSG